MWLGHPDATGLIRVRFPLFVEFSVKIYSALLMGLDSVKSPTVDSNHPVEPTLVSFKLNKNKQDFTSIHFHFLEG